MVTKQGSIESTDDVDDDDDDSEISEIDRQIEEEISAMHSTILESGQSQLEILEPAPKLDWSTYTEGVHCEKDKEQNVLSAPTKGILRLKKGKVKSSPPPEVSSTADNKTCKEGWASERTKSKPKGILKRSDSNPSDWDSSGWNSGGPVSSADLNSGWGGNWGVEVADKAVVPPNSRKSTYKGCAPKAQNQQLGAEFDIMSIQVKSAVKPSPVDDFFAEMEPDLNPRQNLVETLSDVEVKPLEGKMSAPFAVKEVSEVMQ